MYEVGKFLFMGVAFVAKCPKFIPCSTRTPGTLFIGVKFIKFSCFVHASFRATSVAIAPKHTHVDEGAKIYAAPLLYDVGFVGFWGVGWALNLNFRRSLHARGFIWFGSAAHRLHIGCNATDGVPQKQVQHPQS